MHSGRANVRYAGLLAERVRVRPVAHERGVAGFEGPARLLLLIGGHGLGHSAARYPPSHEGEHIAYLLGVRGGLAAVIVEDVAPGAVEQLEEVHRQTLVTSSLVDQPVGPARLPVHRLPTL